MNKRKIYISGPITGVPDFKERFAEVEEMYRQKGFYVISPAKLNEILPEEGTTWEEYMDFALMLMRKCDTIHLLPGWKNSKGATVEYYVALERDMIILEG